MTSVFYHLTGDVTSFYGTSTINAVTSSDITVYSHQLLNLNLPFSFSVNDKTGFVGIAFRSVFGRLAVCVRYRFDFICIEVLPFTIVIMTDYSSAYTHPRQPH
jgi:hypothetical protein